MLYAVRAVGDAGPYTGKPNADAPVGDGLRTSRPP